jgi:hypothetical protein
MTRYQCTDASGTDQADAASGVLQVVLAFPMLQTISRGRVAGRQESWMLATVTDGRDFQTCSEGSTLSSELCSGPKMNVDGSSRVAAARLVSVG